MNNIGFPDPLEREYDAIRKQIEAGLYMHPEEIWDVVKRLVETGEPRHRFWADRLAKYLP